MVCTARQSDRRRRLLAEIGGKPTTQHLLLLERIVDLEWSILKRSAQENRPEFAARELMSMHNHLRLCLREYAALGKPPPPAPKPARVAQSKPPKPAPEPTPIDGLLDDMSRFLGTMK